MCVYFHLLQALQDRTDLNTRDYSLEVLYIDYHIISAQQHQNPSIILYAYRIE